MIFAAMTGKSEWILLFITGLLPLRNVVDRMQDYPLGKDMIDIMIIFALISVGVKVMAKKEGGSGGFTAIHLFAVLMVVYSFLSVIMGSLYLEKALLFSIQDSSVQSWKNFCIMPMMFFLTYATVKDKRLVWRMVAMMCLSLALMNYYTGQQVMWFHGIESRIKIHSTFVYLGPNEIGAFYNTFTMILIGLYFFMKKGLKKMAVLLLILINFYIIIFLFSRAAYVATFIGVFLLLLFKKRFLLIPLIFVAVSWQTMLPEQVVERVQMTTTGYGELDKSSADRLVMWQYSLELFAENPIFGVGYGVFKNAGFVLGDTHNIYFKLLAEQGLIGLLIMLSLLFCFFRKGVQLYRDADDGLSKGLGLGFAVAIVVLFINNIFGDRWTYMEVGGYIWVTAALVSRLHALMLQEKNLQPAVNSKPKKKILYDDLK
jgi:O-antigen ligase